MPSRKEYEHKPTLLNRLLAERSRHPLKPLRAGAIKLTETGAERKADAIIVRYPALKALKYGLIGCCWTPRIVTRIIFGLALACILFAAAYPLMDWNAIDAFLDEKLDGKFGWNPDSERNIGERLGDLFFLKWPLIVLILAVLLILVVLYLLFGLIPAGWSTFWHLLSLGSPTDRQKKIYVTLINRCIDVLHRYDAYFFDFKMTVASDETVAVAFLNKTRQRIPDRVARHIELLLNKQASVAENNGQLLTLKIFYVDHDLYAEEEHASRLEAFENGMDEARQTDGERHPDAPGDSGRDAANGPGPRPAHQGKYGQKRGNGPGISGRPHQRRPQAGNALHPRAAGSGDVRNRAEGSDMFRSRQDNPELERALARLDRLTGLGNVKKRIGEICHAVSLQEVRRQAGQRVQEQTLHMLFLGNPGTGKTTVARITADIFKALGVLSKGHLVEVTREDLVGEHIGETAIKTANVVKNAVGGVLFIDEAYSLYSDSERDYGREAINTLIKYMEDQRRDLVVIMAGYTEEMNRFLKMNSGLKSRFSSVVEFGDYTPDEMMDIFESSIRRQGFAVDDACRKAVRQLFEKRQVPGRKDNGNARLVRNIIEDAIRKQSARLAARMAGGAVTEEEIRLLVPEDFGFAASEEEKPFDLEEELSRIVGHEPVKRHIRELHNLLVVRQNRKEQGLGDGGPGSLHMVFMGNPGTGKTTIARLIARLLKEMGFLKSGHLVETDRSGLVAKYVGQTAARVKDVVEEALGGVLFIDEAYSLHRDDFGKEAIDALVKSMEDHRDNLVVIAAGYSGEMEQFLNANPGLRSRFPTTFEFPDYTPDEIWHILKAMCAAENYVLDDRCEPVVRRLYESVSDNREAGNGRFARNLFERAKIRQATRIRTHGLGDRQSLATLLPEDFEA